MPLPRISVSSRLPTVAKSEKNLRALQPKTICSTSSPTQFPPPSHEHIAHLIRDQKSASEALQSFRWASKLPNFTHNQCTYRSLIYKLCVFRRFEDVHHLLDEMPSSIGAPPDEDIFVTIVRGLGRAQRIREVIKVPALVQRFGLAPSLKIYNTILDVLVKEDIDIARRFFREKMMECGVHGDDYTFGILMKGLSLTNRIGHGFKLLQVMKTRGLTPNTTIYNTLLHALCKNGKVGRARSLMTEMTEPNDVTYNLMISAYCKEDNLVQAQVLLEKSFASGFVPDNVTVTKVMNLLCSVGRAHEAAEVLERTENNGGRVDVVAYNILIRGFCSIEKAKVGVHFKKQMENKGILPNVDTYNALIAGFCNLDLLDSALDLFSEMKADAIDCNLVTYDTLIKGFCSKGRVEEGFRVLEEMEESKVGGRGHISPYNSIIYGLYLQSRYDEALDFLNKMGKMFPRAVDRTLRILGLCNEGKVAGAKEVYDQMILEGGVPSVLVYSRLIEGFCEHKQVREAFELMNEMVSRGYIPGTSIYNAIITGFCRQGKIMSALKLVEDVSAKGFLLNVGTFSPLINALCSKGDLRRAMKIFEQMADQEDESSLDNDYPEFPCNSPKWNRDEDESDSGLHGFVTKDFDQVGHQISSKAVESDGNLRRRKVAYNDIMKNYDELGVRTESLDQAKRKVLRYTPGSWINDVGGKKLSNYVIPKTTTLLLVGPKGSGKSSLVNRISRVFEDDKFASERAQVTYNSSSEEGTFFLEEYMIPRGATSFCLFDTRSLSDNFADNEEMLQYWMTKGLRHGELVVRDADSSSLKMALKCRAQQSGSPSSEIRKVNFVIFVVNGFSALRSMNSDKEEDKRYMEMVVKTFNYPYLSFKDDKPVVAVTHGDFLSLKDRARVRIYLGEKLGVPPAKQIFDIPESPDQATELAIVDMIRYSLEHADKNLPYRGPWEWADRTILSLDSLKLFGTSLMFWTLMFLAILLGIACAVFPMQQSWNHNRLSSAFPVGWPSKSEVEHPYEHQGSFMPFPSRLWSKSAENNSQEQRSCEKQEPETTSPPALPSKDAVAKSARLLRRKSNVDRHRNHRRSHSTSSKSLHPKSKVKWHKVRHLWLDDDSESQHPQSEVEWHKIRHVWSDDDSENRNPKSAVKWHKIRHLRADDD